MFPVRCFLFSKKEYVQKNGIQSNWVSRGPLYNQSSIFMGSASGNSTKRGFKIIRKKKSRKFQNAKQICYINNYLHSIYIVLCVCVCVCVCVLASQSCLTSCNPMDYSPPGSSIHGILQARILERVAISYCITLC